MQVHSEVLTFTSVTGKYIVLIYLLFHCEVQKISKEVYLPVFSSFPDEQELVQKRTFTKWINSHLAKVRLDPNTFSCMFSSHSPVKVSPGFS